MVTPTGGMPQEPSHSGTPFPITPWDTQINNIDDDIIAGDDQEAIHDISDLIESIQSYSPQSPNLSKAVQALAKTQDLIRQGNGIEAVNSLYEAKGFLDQSH